MQRSQSAVDFSNLLNPEPTELARPTPNIVASLANEGPVPGLSLRSERWGESDMASLMLRPNGPIPGIQPTENPSELPRPYKCPLCEKAFHRLEHQTRHIRTHTGEKPHACQFPGCNKKFSRSDELTRHSRIHNNPNSRRGNKNGQATHHVLTGPLGSDSMLGMGPPAGARSIKSAPTSTLVSPNVSPPRSFSFLRGPPPGSEMGVLASAAKLAEREITSAPYHHPSTRHSAYLSNHHARGPLPSLSLYHMSRSSSDETCDDHYSGAYRQTKRSRPNSPNSTAPSSPTLSHESLSPTPDHTPLATPAHSPRLRPAFSGVELPSLRNLSLGHTPALTPMEPQNVEPSTYPTPLSSAPPSRVSSGISLSDIISRPDGSRKLPIPPVPRVSVQDLIMTPVEKLNGTHHLDMNSTTGIAGDDETTTRIGLHQ